jgi:hypothetical protein
MKHTFSAFPAKLHHWYQFTKFCFSERGDQIREARQLTKLGMSVFSVLPQSSRDDLRIEHFEPFVAHIFGIYFSAVGHHDAVQTITLAGHSLDSMILLRSHLETLLAFFYVTEPQNDLGQVFLRTDKYRDWVVIKMKQNIERSLKLDLVRAIVKDSFKGKVFDNYALVQEKYLDEQAELHRLENLNNFLSRAEREAIASKFGIEDLYQHIYAESSASIHFADIGDRMQEIGNSRYHYTIRYKHGAFWPVMLSNMLQFKCIQHFGKFFVVESLLTPKLQTIFGSEKR